MPDKIKEVFELISDKGYFSDENEFRSYVSDPKRRAEAFELIKDDGFFTDENEFNSYFGEVKKKDFQDFNQKYGTSYTRGQFIGQEPISPPISSTVSPSASKQPKSTIPSVSTGKLPKLEFQVEKPVSTQAVDNKDLALTVESREQRKQFLGEVNTGILEAINKQPDLYMSQKDMPTMYGEKIIPAGTLNVDNIAKAVDVYAEKIKKETGKELTSFDKQYVVQSALSSLKVKKQTQNAAMLTDLEFQKQKKLPLTAITGVKNAKGEVVKENMFQENVKQTVAQEQQRLEQIAKTPNKQISAEFKPEIEGLSAQIKGTADALNKEMKDSFTAQFAQQQKEIYNQYNQLVQTGQMSADAANAEMKQKIEAIGKQLENDTNALYAPKFNQLKQEAEAKSKEIQTRYNRKVQAQFNLEKEKASKRIQEEISKYENALPKGYMKEYQAAFKKNLDSEINLEGLRKINQFSNLGNFEKMQTALMAGMGDVTSTVGGSLSYVGVNTGNLQNWVAQSGLYNELPMFSDDNIFDNLTNTDWWIANGVRSVPFTVATMPVGIAGGAGVGLLASALGAAKRAQVIASVIGGGFAGWEVERFLEQGAGFNDAINEGKSVSEAAEIAAAIGKYNYSTLPMNMLQMLPVFSKSFKFLGAAGIEAGAGAFEEINQGWAQAKAKAQSEGQDVSYLDYATSPQAIQEGAIGAAMSQGFTLFSLKNTPDIDKQINTLMTSIGMGGESQALEVLKTMKNNGAIDEKQFQEATNLLNYTLNAISQTENINVDDNVKSALVNRFVAIEKAKELLTENENDLASQAAKELIAEKQEEIKKILKGSEPVYLIRVVGNDVPIVSTKEQVESLLKSEKMLPLFQIEVYNDNSTKASVEEVYSKQEKEKAAEDTPTDTEEAGVAENIPEEVQTEDEKKVKELRAAEQAEYDAMSDPNDEAAKKEIYDRYDKLITPLLEKEKAGSVVGGDKKFTAKGGNKVVDEKGEPLVVYRSTYSENNLNDGVNYFAEDANYSKEIAAIMNENGKASNYVEERPIRTIPVNISASRVYELPKGEEMNGNRIKNLLEKDPDFTKKYDAVKGIDLYSDNKIVYAVFDKANIKELGAEQSLKEKTKEEPAKEEVKVQESIVEETPSIENILNPNHKGFGERMELANKKKESTEQIFEEDKNVNYVFRNTTKEEVDNVLSSKEKTGDFWRSEPNEYKNYGDFVIVKKVPNLKEYGRSYSKANNIENDGFNYIGEKATKEDIDFIYNKKTGEIIYNNNPELVKAVEELLTNKQQEDAVQKQAAGQVPVQPETKVGEGVEGGKPKAEPKEATEEKQEEVAKKAGISPKNLRDLYNVNRKLFGLDRVKAFASAIAMDRMVGTMAKRAGITKAEMYGRLKFEKASEKDLPQGVKMQVDAWHGSPYEFDKFQTAFMGKGEGVQAFGWGLYFSDLEGIARGYANRLTKKGLLIVDNEAYDYLLDLIPSSAFADTPNEFLEIITENLQNENGLDNLLDQYKITSFNDTIQGNERFLNRLKGGASLYSKETLDFVLNLTNSDKSNSQKTKEFNEFFDKHKKAFKDAVDKLKENPLSIVDARPKFLYKVTLHKGKTSDQYTWLEWDKPVDKSILKNIATKLYGIKGESILINSNSGTFKTIFEKNEKGITTSYLYNENTKEKVLANKSNERYNEIQIENIENILLKGQFNQGKENGESFYKEISKIIGSPKQASLFLLENGIDGVKYPAESISRGATSDTARGFNYVVFDENAVSIEEVIKFQKDANKARGAVMVTLDGEAVIYALTDPNVSTPLHELAHVFEHYLTDAEKSAVMKAAGTKAWNTQTSEYFARGFEKYLAEGKSPVPALDKLFAKFKEWLTEIYNGIKGSDIDIKLNKPMRDIYASMLGEKIEGAKFPDNISKIAKELNLSPQQVQNTYKKYDGSKNIEDITLEDYNKARAEGNKAKIENSKKAFEALLKEESASPTAKKKAANLKKEAGDKAVKEAAEIMENIDSIRQQLLDAGVIKSINCKWGK